jgi:hypothetical protein
VATKGQELRKLCSRVHENISARKNREYIFKLPQPPKVVIMAGPGSAKTFRSNFCLRLAEAFYNLFWIRRSRPRQFRMQEFLLYQRFEIPGHFAGCTNSLRKISHKRGGRLALFTPAKCVTARSGNPCTKTEGKRVEQNLDNSTFEDTMNRYPPAHDK